jgi:hypothetical protein
LKATDTPGYITVHEGGIIAPGDATGQFQASEFTLGPNVLGVIFEEDDIFAIDLASATVSDILAVGANNTSAPTLMFEDGAIVRVNLLGGYAPTADNDWLLTTGFATISGDLDNVLLQGDGGSALSDEWSLFNLNGNLLLNYAIPEPSTWALLVIGAALTLTLRRRR